VRAAVRAGAITLLSEIAIGSLREGSGALRVGLLARASPPC
jgi:hypothetical protein